MPHPDAPALTAVRTELERLTARVAGIADTHRDDPDDVLTAQLDDLERSLVSATRRIERTIRSL